MRDQRLSASKISARARIEYWTARYCRDQRLSASKISAPGVPARKMILAEVINAFRHQRFLHPAGTPSPNATYVINAFRHQRFLHFWGQVFHVKRLSDQRLSASKISAPHLKMTSTGHIKFPAIQAPCRNGSKLPLHLPGNPHNFCKIKGMSPFKQVFPEPVQKKPLFEMTWRTRACKAPCPHRHA